MTQQSPFISFRTIITCTGSDFLTVQALEITDPLDVPIQDVSNKWSETVCSGSSPLSTVYLYAKPYYVLSFIN